MSGNGKFLSFDEILAAPDTEYAELDVPEWGGSGKIRVGSLDATKMMEFVEANEGPAKKTAGARLILESLVDEEGNRIGNIKQLAALMKKSAKVINRVALEIVKLNGMDVKTKEKVGNESGEAVNADSPSA